MSDRERDNEILYIPAGHDGDGRDTSAPAREETDAERKTRDFFADCNGDNAQQTGSVSVYRESGGTFGTKSFVESFPADKFPSPESLMIYLRENYGAGDYRLHGRVEGKKGIQMNTLLSITPRLDEKGKSNLPAVIPEGGNGNAMILAQMQRQEDRMLAMMEKMAEKKRPAFSFLENPEILAIIAPIGLELTKNLFKRPDPMKQLESLLGVAGQVKDFREDGQGDSDSWQHVITGALEKFAPALSQYAGQQKAGAPATMPEQQAGQLPPIAQAFAPHINQLLQWAEQNAQDSSQAAPEAVAPAVLKAVPERYQGQFVEWIAKPSSIWNICQIRPDAQKHEFWLDELRHAILDLIDSMESGDTAGYNQPGDLPNEGQDTPPQ